VVPSAATISPGGRVAELNGPPQIKEFFGRLFDGPPEVTIWAPSGWNEW
jgi:hypothetical protein